MRNLKILKPDRKVIEDLLARHGPSLLCVRYRYDEDRGEQLKGVELEKLSKTTEAEVVARSRRRCCICFGFNGDSTRKEGQSAHPDRDSANDALDNLAFLRLAHHNKDDSRPSQ